MVPPRDGGTDVSSKVVPRKASRGRVFGLAPGKCALHFQPMAHLLLDIHLESVVPGLACPKSCLNQPRSIDVWIELCGALRDACRTARNAAVNWIRKYPAPRSQRRQYSVKVVQLKWIVD